MGYAEDAKLQVAKSNTRPVWSAASAELTLKNHDPQKEWEAFYDAVGEKLGSSFTSGSVSYDVELILTAVSLPELCLKMMKLIVKRVMV